MYSTLWDFRVGGIKTHDGKSFFRKNGGTNLPLKA